MVFQFDAGVAECLESGDGAVQFRAELGALALDALGEHHPGQEHTEVGGEQREAVTVLRCYRNGLPESVRVQEADDPSGGHDRGRDVARALRHADEGLVGPWVAGGVLDDHRLSTTHHLGLQQHVRQRDLGAGGEPLKGVRVGVDAVDDIDPGREPPRALGPRDHHSGEPACFA